MICMAKSFNMGKTRNWFNPPTLLVLFLVFLQAMPASATLHTTSTSGNMQLHHHYHNLALGHGHIHRRYGPLPVLHRPPFCFHSQNSRQEDVIAYNGLTLPPPEPPTDIEDEIDQRYGVQKRLVPSGPNPLHN